ncbi:MAG: hypothetical protein ACERKD_02845 [Prolixibacteraceae bacterium]
METRQFKKSIPEWIIGLSLILLVISFGIGWTRSIDTFQIQHEVSINFINAIQLLFLSNNFLRPLLLLIALIGFFIHRPIGWMAICTLFYFLIFDWFYIGVTSNDYNATRYSLFAAPLLLIIVANFSSFRAAYHLGKFKVVILNLMNMGIALTLIGLKTILHIYVQKDMNQIIELFK